MITKRVAGQISEINELILSVDGNRQKSDDYSFRAMHEHVSEIRELYLANNEHWVAEAADLVIHCLLLLDRNGHLTTAMEKTFHLRVRRFREKIAESE